MILTRRRVLEVGGGILAALLARPAAAWSASVEIAMQGRPDGSHVWFDPIGLHIEPGQTVRWINRDRGNSHTIAPGASQPKPRHGIRVIFCRRRLFPSVSTKKASTTIIAFRTSMQAWWAGSWSESRLPWKQLRKPRV